MHSGQNDCSSFRKCAFDGSSFKSYYSKNRVKTQKTYRYKRVSLKKKKKSHFYFITPLFSCMIRVRYYSRTRRISDRTRCRLLRHLREYDQQ